MQTPFNWFQESERGPGVFRERERASTWAKLDMTLHKLYQVWLLSHITCPNASYLTCYWLCSTKWNKQWTAKAYFCHTYNVAVQGFIQCHIKDITIINKCISISVIIKVYNMEMHFFLTGISKIQPINCRKTNKQVNFW